jgi:formate hydrogenlyase subunit 3/multisubunit Na+/H+ antiporter MnhD subunit
MFTFISLRSIKRHRTRLIATIGCIIVSVLDLSILFSISLSFYNGIWIVVDMLGSFFLISVVFTGILCTLFINGYYESPEYTGS